VTNGAEIPFRRPLRKAVTGSLILDHGHADHVRQQAARKAEGMRVWTNGRFRET